MKCKAVLGHLSAYFDDRIEEGLSAGISKHLRECETCGLEFQRLRQLRHVLATLPRVEAPRHLRGLLDRRIRNARRESWVNDLRSAWEYQWSKMRTMGAMWYLSRLAGVITTAGLFVAISAALNPVYLALTSPLHERAMMSQSLRPQQLRIAVLTNLGLSPRELQKIPISRSDAKINDQYWYDLGQAVSRTTGSDDTVSIVTEVSSSGAPKIQNVLEYPDDDSLLSEFAGMILSARWRPASQNGRAVDSRLVMTFSKVCVYD
ncbi:MAG: hypothetical protein H6Q05_1497 [Acidobacteria bacterium]|nr:hypothetical protein [Acidobacteriota bacterium]